MRYDDYETISREVLAEMRAVSQARSRRLDDGLGYWPARLGESSFTIRWHQGKAETVCLVDLYHERVLALRDVADAHEELLDALEAIAFDVFTVEGFVHPTCPSCGGQGYFVYEHDYTVSGSGYGDAQPKETIEACANCDGHGHL